LILSAVYRFKVSPAGETPALRDLKR
jgi:hypothetical protein